MADGDQATAANFGLESNAEAPPAPTGRRDVQQGREDLGAARVEGKEVTQDQLRQEFDLPGAPKRKDREPVRERIVDTDVDDDDDDVAGDEQVDDDDEPPAKKKETETDGADGEFESIEDWLADLDEETEQEIAAHLLGRDDLETTVKANGKDERITLAELKRRASGYAGEEAANTKLNETKAQLEARTKALDDREAFFANQFEDPRDLMTFLDGQVKDPVKYFTSLRDHADAVLKEAEENPAAFARQHRVTRENAQLRGTVAQLADVVKTIAERLDGKSDSSQKTGDEKDEKGTAAAEETARVAEGQRRQRLVIRAGYKVDPVADAYQRAGKPADFERWFTRWSRKNPPTNGRADDGSKQRRRAGGTLRRRGSSTGGGGPRRGEDNTSRDLTQSEIGEFLRTHPANRER